MNVKKKPINYFAKKKRKKSFSALRCVYGMPPSTLKLNLAKFLINIFFINRENIFYLKKNNIKIFYTKFGQCYSITFFVTVKK